MRKKLAGELAEGEKTGWMPQKGASCVSLRGASLQNIGGTFLRFPAGFFPLRQTFNIVFQSYIRFKLFVIPISLRDRAACGKLLITV